MFPDNARNLLHLQALWAIKQLSPQQPHDHSSLLLESSHLKQSTCLNNSPFRTASYPSGHFILTLSSAQLQFLMTPFLLCGNAFKSLLPERHATTTPLTTPSQTAKALSASAKRYDSVASIIKIVLADVLTRRQHLVSLKAQVDT
jgi:hypothetical protein